MCGLMAFPSVNLVLRFPMLQNTHAVLVGLLAVIGAILFKVPDTLEAGVLFFLIVALVGVLLLHDARITMLRVSCAAILLMIFAGVLCF